MIALIDCNNFFVSCERLFRPDLDNKPVVVLSSNDGCVVSRSNEAKALGIPMAAPAFKSKHIFRENGVVQFSANFELYGDISRRITQLLTTITPNIEVYSVDESFLDLSELDIKNYRQWGLQVGKLIEQWVGIPVSVGIASTKTLAKLASNRAKKDPGLKGVNFLGNEVGIKAALLETPIENLWGVGWRLAPSLRAAGLATSYDIAKLPTRMARQLFGGVRGEQIVRELNSEACWPISLSSKLAQSIARTRTFGEDTNQFFELESAVASFATQAAFRLRLSHQLTKKAELFLTTNRNKPNYRKFSLEVRLNVPSSDTGTLISSLVKALKQVYDPNIYYHRAGVTLYHFVPESELQLDLLGYVKPKAVSKERSRMRAIDKLNSKLGKNKVHYAAEDLGGSWQPKHNVRSPRYTTEWDELPRVRISTW